MALSAATPRQLPPRADKTLCRRAISLASLVNAQPDLVVEAVRHHAVAENHPGEGGFADPTGASDGNYSNANAASTAAMTEE